MTISVVLISIVFCAVFQSIRTDSSAQPGVDTDIMGTLQRRIQTFCDSLADGSATAYSSNGTLFTDSQAQDQAIQEMILKTDELIKGGRWQYEYLDAKPVGKDIILVRYLYKSELRPVVWYFTFYRSPTTRPGETAASPRTWNCIGVRFDTNLDAFFNESGLK